MIHDFVNDIAVQMKMKLSRISVVEGHRVGCLDMHLLKLASKGQVVSALLHQTELENLREGKSCDRLELKVRSALTRLQLLLEP
jgi:hypothetical protein